MPYCSRIQLWRHIHQPEKENPGFEFLVFILFQGWMKAAAPSTTATQHAHESRKLASHSPLALAKQYGQECGDKTADPLKFIYWPGRCQRCRLADKEMHWFTSQRFQALYNVSELISRLQGIPYKHSAQLPRIVKFHSIHHNAIFKCSLSWIARCRVIAGLHTFSWISSSEWGRCSPVITSIHKTAL